MYRGVVRTSRSALTSATIAAIAVLTGCAAAPTTTITDADGSTVIVDWADYPGHAGIDAAQLVNAPPEQEVEAVSSALLDAIGAQLSDRFGVTFTVEGDDIWTASQGNGYGGESLLTSYNSAARETSTIPSAPDDWRAIVAIVTEEAIRAGLGPVVLDHESESYLRDESWQKDTRERFGTDDPDQFWSWSGFAYGDSQWLSISLSDARRDASGEAVREAKKFDSQGQSISVFYGATTVQADSRIEFAEKIKPFIGLTPPPSTTSD